MDALDCRAKPHRDSSESMSVKTGSYMLTALIGITVRHEQLMPNVSISLKADVIMHLIRENRHFYYARAIGASASRVI